MKSLLWVIAQAYGLISVVFISVLVVRAVVDVLEVPAVPATILEWTCAAAVGAGTWRWWRFFRGNLMSEGLAEERATGEALRQSDPSRFRDFLSGATDTLAITDPDRFVGMQVAGESGQEEPRAELRIRSRRWKASTSPQASAVDRLTKELEHAILIHTP